VTVREYFAYPAFSEREMISTWITHKGRMSLCVSSITAYEIDPMFSARHSYRLRAWVSIS
jgi:hypothetical protein